MIDTDELDQLLQSCTDLPDARKAEEQTVNAALELAKTTLKTLTEQIKKKISNTERSLITSLNIPSESPAVSLMMAALKKRGYHVDVKRGQ